MPKKYNIDAQAGYEVSQIAQEVLDILEADDGRSFDEKKADASKLLEGKLEAYKKEKEAKKKRYASTGVRRRSFWSHGNMVYSDENIILRHINDEDKERYIELRHETLIFSPLAKDDSFFETLWEDHNAATAIICSIIDVSSGDYIGYCSVKDISAEKWELAIELKEKWRGKGVGTLAMQKFLDVVVSRCDVSVFRARISSDNYASQALVEKLGGIPNGISEFLLHGEKSLIECEEENINLIDDKLESVAEKFGVEPRKLLSHVLEYKLIWDKKV